MAVSANCASIDCRGELAVLHGLHRQVESFVAAQSPPAQTFASEVCAFVVDGDAAAVERQQFASTPTSAPASGRSP